MVALKTHRFWKRDRYMENMSHKKERKEMRSYRNEKETRFIDFFPGPCHKTITIHKSKLHRGGVGRGGGSSQTKNPLQEIRKKKKRPHSYKTNTKKQKTHVKTSLLTKSFSPKKPQIWRKLEEPKPQAESNVLKQAFRYKRHFKPENKIPGTKMNNKTWKK